MSYDCHKTYPEFLLVYHVSFYSLLSHEDDSHVADGALKCFASLADRFIRKNVDPMPLAAHGLTKELLNRLSSAGNRPGMTTAVSGTPGAGATSTPGLRTFLNTHTDKTVFFHCKHHQNMPFFKN